MIFFAIRHGETDFNKDGIFMGSRVDAPLNETGSKQVRSLLPQLKGQKYEALYSSPMQRTAQTAEIISEELGLPIVFRKELRERDVGTLSGKAYEDVMKETKDEDLNNNEKYDYSPYGGESYIDVTKRVQKFLDEIELKHRGDEHVLIVTHAGIIKVLYSLYNPKKQQDVHNVCVHQFN